MKFTASSLLFLALLGVFLVGCGSGEPRKSTDGASAQSIADYEAAVAAAEGNMSTSAEASETEE